MLPYVAQQAVQTHHWLSAGQMLDGLGLAETTPGPLIILRGNEALTTILSAVTAAVVGVVLNLAVWFGLHVIFPGDGTVDSFAIPHRHRCVHQNGPLEVGYYPRNAWCGFCRPDLQNVLKLLSLT